MPDVLGFDVLSGHHLQDPPSESVVQCGILVGRIVWCSKFPERRQFGVGEYSELVCERPDNDKLDVSSALQQA